MHSLTLDGSPEPPLSPPTVGRPTLVEAPEPEAATEGERPLSLASDADEDTAERRVVVRLAGGDEVEVARLAGRAPALARAGEIVRMLSEAETAGDWAELDGRFLRPAAIVSVDVLRAED